MSAKCLESIPLKSALVAILVGLSIIYLILMYSTSNDDMIIYRMWRKSNLKKSFPGKFVEDLTMSINKCSDDWTQEIYQRKENETNRPVKFIEDLKNPCWFEDYNWEDLEEMDRNPYHHLRRKAHVDQMLTELKLYYEFRLQKNHTRRLRCLPYFLIIGQAKCGTTDLYHRLAMHPQIAMGLLKEPDWWTRSRTGMLGKLNTRSNISFSSFLDLFGFSSLGLERELIQRCKRNLGQNGFRSAFSKCDQTIIGDGSVATFSDNTWRGIPSVADVRGNGIEPNATAAHFIKWLLPDVRIIVLLREPVSRLFSDYLFFDHSGRVSQADFHRRVVKAIRYHLKCRKLYGDHRCLSDKLKTVHSEVHLHLGIYSVELNNWLKVFPRKQIFVLRMEDYSSDVGRSLREIYSFLNVCTPTEWEEEAILNLTIKNKGHQRIGPMWSKTKVLLREFYHGYNVELARMLNDNRFLWSDFS